jgi:hypothetical protein
LVRRDAAITERRISMSKKKRPAGATAATLVAAKPAQRTAVETKGKNANPESKQSRVLTMLQSSAGTTIAAMMQATGWQQHSVRGFLAGVVRKRLKLKLEPKKVDGTRVYQIAKGDARRSKPRQSRRQSS